ncbi:MAG TPA: hypothetical protein PLR74_14235 [Agriterribacter sp.]|nr:hypothetical protein [Agriterribacter sp.]
MEYHKLLTEPAVFFSTGIHFHNAGDLFSTADDASWSNAGENLLIKLLAIFNVFSGSNYYINVVFCNALSFFGLYLLYVTVRAYAPKNRLLLFGLIFFFPSCLFWNSGIDKDGLIVCFTGIFIYTVHYCITVRPTVWKVAVCIAGFMFIFLLRSVNALLLLPAVAAWWVAVKYPVRPYVPFLVSYSLAVLFFFLSVHLSPAFNLPLKLAEKQHQFLALQANTVLPLTSLQPTVKSYAAVLPEAANHVFLRPYITEIKSPFHLMAFVEIVCILLVLLLAAVSAGKQIFHYLTQPFFLFFIVVAVSGLLLIGYTVPFPGAIVRYKSLYIVFLLIPFVALLKGKNKN